MGRASNCVIYAEPCFCLYFALLMLLIPLPWLMAWFAAAMIHELGHCVCVLALGGQIESIHIGIRGAEICAGSLSDLRSFFSSLSGPLCGLLLTLFSAYVPKLALCALLQSVYNLLPVLPLDGGQALYRLLCVIFTQQAPVMVCRVIGGLVITIVILAGIFLGVVLQLGVLPILLAMAFGLHLKK